MPDMDGLALINWLQQHYPDIIAVIISGHSEFEYVQQAIHNRVFYYILKPLDMEDVESLLKALSEELSVRRSKKDS